MSAINSILDWLAPSATIIAAMMTAANLGARVTGWGFAIFLIASLAWTAIGVTGGQTSLIYANAFLIVVNAFGVWRWLGRQAAYEDGAAKAAAHSAYAKVPSLFSFNALLGAKLNGKDGNAVGTIVDIMGTCSSGEIAYFVVSEGGIGGVGERLHALPASYFDLSGDEPSVELDIEALRNATVLETGAWPTKL